MDLGKLTFENWKNPEVDGWPPEWEWSLALWGDREKPEVFVGGYNAENKTFYANFGLGGAVLDQEHVFAWTLLSENRWEEGNNHEP